MKKIFIQNADGTFIKKYRCPSCKELFDEEYNVKSAYCKKCTIKKYMKIKQKEWLNSHSFLLLLPWKSIKNKNIKIALWG